MKKSVGIIIALILLVGGIVYASIGPSSAYHSIKNLGVSGAGELDKDGNGIIDYCDSLTEELSSSIESSASSVVNINTSEPYHSLEDIALNASDLTPVDSDGNGWPDICDNVSTGLVELEYGEDFFHNPSQISRSDTNIQSIDSDGNGWPDKGDCIISELQTDVNNCGSCGNVCPADNPVCIQGNCEQPVWVRIAYGSSHPLYTYGFDSDVAILQEIEDIALEICDDAPNGCVVDECHQVGYNAITGSVGGFLDYTDCTDYEYGTCYCGWKSSRLNGIKFYSIFCRNHYCELV